MHKFKITPINYIYFLFTLGILALVSSLIYFGGDFLEKIVYDYSYFVDFFDHVRRFYLGLENVYTEGMHACFPPLAYCMYYLVSRILYKDNIDKPDTLNSSGSGILIICMLIMVFAVLFLFSFLKMFRENSITRKKWMAALLMCSYPFWLAIERGNMSLLVLVILMYAMAFKNSQQKYEREIALLLFAVAAALKLYPAVFGILYLINKRYKEALRLVIYGVFFFFVPFVFFQGWNGFQLFLHNLTAVGSGATGITIVGIFGRMAVNLGLSLERGHAIGRIISYIYFGFVIIYCFIKKESWKSVTLLTSLMIIFVAASGTYCLIYCSIPFVCFLNDLGQEKEVTKIQYLYSTLFVLIFAAYPVKVLGSSGMLYIALYLLIAILVFEQIICGVKSVRFRMKSLFLL